MCCRDADHQCTFARCSTPLSKQDVYADILSYVLDILRPLTEAVDTEGGSRPLPGDQAAEPRVYQVYQTSLWFASMHQGPTQGYRQQEWNDFYNQWTDQVGRLASSEPGTSVPGPSIRPRLSLRHRGAEALA